MPGTGKEDHLKTFNKLIRDNIPAVIIASGETPITRVLDGEQYLQALITKLGEEYDEFKQARNVEELADLQEVVLALADAIASRTELEAVRAAKAAERGTFKGRIFLERTE